MQTSAPPASRTGRICREGVSFAYSQVDSGRKAGAAERGRTWR